MVEVTCFFRNVAIVLASLFHQVALTRTLRMDLSVIKLSYHLAPIYHTQWRFHRVNYTVKLNVKQGSCDY